MNNMKNDSGKILMATFAGIGAGIAAGILLSPKNGEQNREELKRSLAKAGDELNTTLKSWTEGVKAKVNEMTSTSKQDEQLVMHGSWEDVKRQLSANYAELTEEDLDYNHGGENELLGRLQTRLNKTKDEVVKLLSDLKG
jgi:gas vesicle protein